ncbi:MAG: rhodanese-like domain-containing protein [Syntrophotaleaceae bacterium]
MNKSGILLTVLTLFAFCRLATAGEYRNLPLTQELVDSGVLIVDIRTPPEWRETGVIPGSVLLTFFGQDRSYDLDGFIADLQLYADRNRDIALLCRSGNRTAKAAGLLAERGYTSVINVTGGIRTAPEKGIKLVPYPDEDSLED